jgi:hypothetical protein
VAIAPRRDSSTAGSRRFNRTPIASGIVSPLNRDAEDDDSENAT